MSSKAIFLALCTSVVLSTGTTHAALFDRGNGLIYDDVLNVTWLQDANYAKTSGYDADGLMHWSDAADWAANLTYGGYDDWRLPRVRPINGIAFDYSSASYSGAVDTGLRITSPNAELSYLFYVELGNDAALDRQGNHTSCSQIPSTACLTNSGPFMNLLPSKYWYGQKFELLSGSYYWDFNFAVGWQSAESDSLYSSGVWAVRDGDVTSVPEPASLSLTIAGLAILGVLLKKRSLES